jgi:hypothetical protein
MQSRVDGVESCRFNLLDTGMATAKLALEVVSRERNREMMRIDDILWSNRGNFVIADLWRKCIDRLSNLKPT